MRLLRTIGSIKIKNRRFSTKDTLILLGIAIVIIGVLYFIACLVGEQRYRRMHEIRREDIPTNEYHETHPCPKEKEPDKTK